MKKIIASVAAALLSFSVFAATLVPPQLLNPAGSTAGQAIVSTGPTTAPGFANVPIANVTGAAPLASPTFTGVPAAPNAAGGTNTTQLATTAFVLGSLGAAPNGICNTTACPASFTTIGATGLISPTSTVGIKGTVTNDNAQAGSVGEFPTPTNLSGVPLTSGVAANVGSVPLTAGDYEVSGSIQYLPAGTTVPNTFASSISTTSGTRPVWQQESLLIATFAAGNAQQQPTPAVRISIPSTTTIYLVAFAGFATSTMTANGNLHVRRLR
jgi:hypothetical protein